MKKTAILIYLASAFGAWAHTGHDPALPADGVAHWLLSPLHLLGAVALLGVIVLVHRAFGERNDHE